MKQRLSLQLLIMFIFMGIAPSIAHSSNEAAIDAYGKKTSLYISSMHYTAISVAQKAVDLSNNPILMQSTGWRSVTLSNLRTLLAASDGIQHIHLVPNGWSKVNQDLVNLGVKMEVAATTYKRGIETSNPNLVYEAFQELKDVDDTLVALSNAAHPNQ